MIQKGFHDMAWELFKISFASNKFQLLLVFVVFFIIGCILSIAACGINKEKKKKGFKDGRLHGKAKKIDKQLYDDFKDLDPAERYSYLKDNMEHHASKKFK